MKMKYEIISTLFGKWLLPFNTLPITPTALALFPRIFSYDLPKMCHYRVHAWDPAGYLKGIDPSPDFVPQGSSVLTLAFACTFFLN
jgi:hypothetical protein